MRKTGPPEERTAVKMFSATIAEQDLMQLRCAGHYHSTPQVTPYAFIVVAQTTILIVVVINQTTIGKNQGPHQETLGNQVLEWTTIE